MLQHILSFPIRQEVEKRGAKEKGNKLNPPKKNLYELQPFWAGSTRFSLGQETVKRRLLPGSMQQKLENLTSQKMHWSLHWFTVQGHLLSREGTSVKKQVQSLQEHSSQSLSEISFPWLAKQTQLQNSPSVLDMWSKSRLTLQDKRSNTETIISCEDFCSTMAMHHYHSMAS